MAWPVRAPERLQFKISRAKPEDLDLLVSHRQKMWEDVHPEMGAEILRSTRRTRAWIRGRLVDGTLVGFIARMSEGGSRGPGANG